MHDDLLTIGRFARLCRLSVKQLRHYDDLGLLAPVRVDPDTGYRYYAPDQARDALTIALLRDVDLPLAVIAQALAADPGPRTRILRAQRDRLAERITRDQARLAVLERLAEDGLPAYEVAAGTEPDRRLVAVRARCAPAGIGAAFGTCAGRLAAALGGTGGTDSAGEHPLWALYPLDLADPMEIAVGVCAPPGQAPPGLESVDLPGGPVLHTTHVGSYAELPLAYNALFAAVHERGLTPRPPVCEAHPAGPREAEPGRPGEPAVRLVLGVEEATV
ncbi:MerR family transcriptional regulator [Streptomonospora sp. S1-112]|uniref:MerR family transcriptional regulator n=1 Tax=Streptomonospora mangrovi TaxID=2883123 RepID=A0A9X3NMI7_9ACTN|nr:MerR family transcriptional regulator [Streptomonospora mangrovi]MDA0565720.1 MerR family transcriptional regulator [Streptomonospora mangrovi]